MKRKTLLVTITLFFVSSLLLIWSGEGHKNSKYRVLLIGMDGGSWDILRRLASENRIPNIRKLIDNGSAGYLNSILWRKRTTGGYGYFSPIVWSSIATGKLPNKHGVEDFKLPLPSTSNFRMGYGEKAEPSYPTLVFPFNNKDRMILRIRAKAPPRIQQLRLQAYLNKDPIGLCQLTEQYSEHSFEIPPQSITYGENQITFGYSENTQVSGNYVGADIEFLRVYNSAGQEILDYHPARNKKLFVQGWIFEPLRQFTLASSYHFRTNTLWEILSNFNKKVAVVGWWATWPAYRVNGYLVTNQVGLHGERSGRNFLKVLPHLTYPPEFVQEITPLYQPKETMVPEFNKLFFEMGRCPCVGSLQERIVLTRFWQDKYFGDIAGLLLSKKQNFDLFAVYFRGTDTMAHQFIGFSENMELLRNECGSFDSCDLDDLHRALDNYYRFVDQQIGKILAHQGKNTITMIVSDHGEAAAGKKGTHQNNGFIIVAGPGIRRSTLTASVLDITPTILYLLDLPVAQDMDGQVLKQTLQPGILMTKDLSYIDSYDRILRNKKASVVIDRELEEQDTEELKALGYIND
jgi:predicted AlkP superfamily phosphohydrolase/phosphomutase